VIDETHSSLFGAQIFSVAAQTNPVDSVQFIEPHLHGPMLPKFPSVKLHLFKQKEGGRRSVPVGQLDAQLLCKPAAL
jgi:hypothetical protein